MSEVLERNRFLQVTGHIIDCLEERAAELGRLDAAMGDGDMGVTVTLGCHAIRKALPALADQDIGAILTRSAMAFNGAAPSTLGALFAISGMRAGKEARGATTVDLPMLARMTRAGELGIRERGKAERGDKTLLDVLGPIADVLEDAASRGEPLLAAVEAAEAAARTGLEATIQMAAKSGRGSWISERTVGHPDPGATAVLIIWEAFVESIRNPEAPV
jgi:dihydroxyacetone kinase-like protein